MVEKPAQAINDSESQSHPAPPLMLGAGELMKLREDVLVLILRNAVPAVPHLYAQLRAAPAAANHDPAADRIGDCIGHQIQQNPLQQDGVAAHPGAVRHDPEREPIFACRCRESALGPLEQMRDRKVGDSGCQHQGVEFGNVQQIIEQFVHGGNRRVDLLEDSAPFGGRHGPVQSADE